MEEEILEDNIEDFENQCWCQMDKPEYDLSDFAILSLEDLITKTSNENSEFHIKNSISLKSNIIEASINKIAEEAEKRGYAKGISDHSKRVEDLISQAKEEALEEVLREVDQADYIKEIMSTEKNIGWRNGYVFRQNEDKKIIQSLIKKYE